MNIKQITIPIIIALILLPMGVFADSRGLSVSQSEIFEGVIMEWPKIVDMSVQNMSNNTEWIEITAHSSVGGAVAITPSMFALGGGETSRIVFTFEEPTTIKSAGLIKISATRNNTDGLTTGTGVEIPYVLSKDSLRAGDMQAAIGGIGQDGQVGNLIDSLIWISIVIGVLTLLLALSRRMGRRI